MGRIGESGLTRRRLLIAVAAASLGIVCGWSSAMLTANLTANALVAAVFLTMLHTLDGAGTFGVFGLLAIAGFVLVYRFAPETKGRQLEDIRHVWGNYGRWPDENHSAPTNAHACR